LPIGWQVLHIQVCHLLSAHLASKHGDLSGGEDEQLNSNLGTTAGPSHANTEAMMRLLKQLAQSNAQLMQSNTQLTQSHAQLTQSHAQVTQSNTQLTQSNARLVAENASLLEIITVLQRTT
jgi:septal ring factor EnvC (AmiA/AmiB activator)